MAISIVITDFNAHAAAIRAVRTAVFVKEQAIPREDEFDEHDPACLHAIAFDAETAVATGRINFSQAGRLGRIAVLPSHRRLGLGTTLIKALEAVAKKENLKRIWFHAQVQAVPFYNSLGYQTVGAEFVEDSIMHVKMEKKL